MPVMTQRAPLFAVAGRESAGVPSPQAAQRSSAPAAPRRRGRPPLCTPEQVLEEIRGAVLSGNLFRAHLDRPALYARARRLWGTWGGALRAAGLDPRAILDAARQRAVETRRRRREAARL